MNITSSSNAPQPRGLLRVMRETMRLAHMSIFTEKNYILWVRQFILFHKRRHPKTMSAREIVQFLSYLATERKVSASTQNQALNAIVFLYKKVLRHDPGKFEGICWARRSRQLPVVLSVEEVKSVLKNLNGVQWVLGCLLYGTGMRLAEALKLRVKDVDFERNMILVRDGKGAKDRVVPFPKFLRESLRKQLETAKYCTSEI